MAERRSSDDVRLEFYLDEESESESDIESAQPDPSSPVSYRPTLFAL